MGTDHLPRRRTAWWVSVVVVVVVIAQSVINLNFTMNYAVLQLL